MPFLVRMAKATLPQEHRVVIPYPMEAREDRGGVEEERGEGTDVVMGEGGGGEEQTVMEDMTLPRGVE